MTSESFMPKTTKIKMLSKFIHRICKQFPVNLKRKEAFESPHPVKTTPVQVLPFWVQPQRTYHRGISFEINCVQVGKIDRPASDFPLTVIEDELFMTMLW
jgi:hypothetical protein